MASTARVILGDCKQMLSTLESESFDALVTDPPAGISFMGKAWDSYESLQHFQEDLTVIFKEALRVMKAGAHGLVWALPRTSGFTMMALVNAGFEVRDSIVHLFGSGMPKGLNVAKAGAGPEWEGWNTTLKPAHEIWWLVRKPLTEKTVLKQVQATGTGALHIDACRVEHNEVATSYYTTRDSDKFTGVLNGGKPGHFRQDLEIRAASISGRWPANVVLSHAEDCGDSGECSVECAVQALDEQSGDCPAAYRSQAMALAKMNEQKPCNGQHNTYGKGLDTKPTGTLYTDAGGASRFFYTAKLPRNERKLPDGTANQHPTAKSVKLMRYFVRLVTPPKGTILDPFAGSGTTGVAAVKEGFSFVGIELDPEHHRVAELRVMGSLRDREDQEWMLSEEA